MFCTFSLNLVILAWTDQKLSRGQTRGLHTDGHNRQTDRQTQTQTQTQTDRQTDRQTRMVLWLSWSTLAPPRRRTLWYISTNVQFMVSLIVSIVWRGRSKHVRRPGMNRTIVHWVSCRKLHRYLQPDRGISTYSVDGPFGSNPSDKHPVLVFKKSSVFSKNE